MRLGDEKETWRCYFAMSDDTDRYADLLERARMYLRCYEDA
jgi:hypothetical protein